MIILGIDPGFAILGYGVIEVKGNSFKSLSYGVISTEAGVIMPERLKAVYEGINAVINEFRPEEVSIEELFFNKNVKTAILVAQARGVAIVAAANAGIPVYEYTPLQVKQGLVGYGRADKKQVQIMVKNILGLKEIPRPDDAADALAVAVCHAHSINYISKCKV